MNRLWPAPTVEIPDAGGEVLPYRIERAPDGLDEFAVWVTHEDDPQQRYRVGVDRLGLWRCSCADWRYRHLPAKVGGCKHVVATRQIKQLMDSLGDKS